MNLGFFGSMWCGKIGLRFSGWFWKRCADGWMDGWMEEREGETTTRLSKKVPTFFDEEKKRLAGTIP